MSFLCLSSCREIQDIYNPSESAKKLRILDIGNSYTDDATSLIPLLIKMGGDDVSNICLYKITRNNASFKTWCDIFFDLDDGEYSFKKIIGGLSVSIPDGKSSQYDGSLFRRVLSEPWDIIIIHQSSKFAPYYDLWASDSEGGYVDDYLSLLHSFQPNARIGFQLVHSYSSAYVGNKEKSSRKRWELIVKSAEFLLKHYSISFIIPYGTAIQNIRETAYNNEFDLCRDGVHCAFGLAQYTAACSYYESVLSPILGHSVVGNPARYLVPENLKSYASSIDVTDDCARLAQIAAKLANDDWTICVNPEFPQNRMIP